jgi:hypothetical protein
MSRSRKAGLLFSALMIAIAALRGISIAQQSTGSSTSPFRAVYENVSNSLGRYRLDTINNFFVFGSTKQIPGSVLSSSGTFIVQSTTTSAGNPVIQALSSALSSIFLLDTGGNVTIPGTLTAGTLLGNGSRLTGVPASGSTTTWSGSNYYANLVQVSSPTSKFVSGSSATFNGAIYGTPAYVAVWTSSATASSNFGINLANGFGEGTLTFLKGSSFPATVKVVYVANVSGNFVPGSPANANNGAISVSPSAQRFTANTSLTVTVSNNPGAGYTTQGSIIFVGYDP